MSFSLRNVLFVVVIACATTVALAAPLPGALAQSAGGSVGDAFDSGGSATGDPVAEVPPDTPPPPTTEPPVPAETPPDGGAGAPPPTSPPTTVTVGTTAAPPSPTTAAPQQPGIGAAAQAPVALSGPLPLDPFPVVRIRGRITRTGARISLLLVRAPIGARVSVRCRGTCPVRRLARATSARALRVRSFERHLRAGTLVEVSVTRPGSIGKYTRFRIRRRGAPARTDLCLVPGQPAPRACR